MYTNYITFFKLLFIFLTTSNIYARNYNNATLEIFSKITPRLVFMSSQKQNINKTINICIIRNSSDIQSSKLLIDKILKNYPKGINNYPIELIETDFNKINICKKCQLSFIFDEDENSITNTIKELNNFKILTVSYNNKYLKNGVGVSIFIGKKVLPYINIKAIYSHGIEIDNILLRVSKIYREEK